jgi:Kef-type K+ transport system membrane component KefB
MSELITFFIILGAGLFFSGVLSRVHVPWVVALITAGAVLGPHGTGTFIPTPTIEFIGQVGLVFLMFMAGLETKPSSFSEHRREIARIAALNGLIPLGVGVLIGVYFGYPLTTALLVGIIFVSSSIAVIIPSLTAKGIAESRVGKSIIAATVAEDIASLVMLSVLLQTISPETQIPLPLFYLLLYGVLVVMRWAIPKLRWVFIGEQSTKDTFERELRLIVATLIGTVIIFELLGLHAIIAGFFTGLVLSDSIRNKIIKEKINALSYGIFIPVFFVLVGAEINLGVFSEAKNALALTAAIVGGSIAAKGISGWVAGKMSGFTKDERALTGIATTPQLSTTLAVVFTGAALGLLDEKMVTAMIVLSITTTFLAPMAINLYKKNEELNEMKVEAHGI